MYTPICTCELFHPYLRGQQNIHLLPFPGIDKAHHNLAINAPGADPGGAQGSGPPP